MAADAAPVERKRKRNAVCMAFLQGDCKYGVECRYKHPKAQSEQSDSFKIATALGTDGSREEKMKRVNALPEKLRAKARAVFFAKQKNGDWTRDEDQWKAKAEGMKMQKGVCFDFQKGKCGKGDACPFAHRMETAGEKDGTAGPPAAAAPAAAQASTRTSLDSSGANKKMKFDGAGEKSEKKKPCRWFLKGECKRGADCFFSH
jgi:hypothetical protein